MVEPFSVDSQLSMIVILSRAVELCWVKVYTGGIPLESFAEGAVKNSEIETETAYITPCRSHTDKAKSYLIVNF